MIEPERHADVSAAFRAEYGLPEPVSEKVAARARMALARDRMHQAYQSYTFWSDLGAGIVGTDRAEFHAAKRFAEWCEEVVRYEEARMELAKKG